MQTVSANFYNGLVSRTKRLTAIVEIYHQDALPSADGFDPASGLFIAGFTKKADFEFRGKAFAKLLSGTSSIKRTLKKQLSDANFTLSNLTREAYQFEKLYGFEGLICVIRLVDWSNSQTLDDSIVLFTGRCEKPDNFSRSNEQVSISVKQILNQTDAAFPRRKFAVDDAEGRTFSDPEYEGFRFSQRSGSVQYPERVKRGGILGFFGFKKNVTRTLQYSSHSDLDAERFVPLALGRVQMQGLHLGYEDKGTFIQTLTAWCDGWETKIKAVEFVRSITPRFPVSVIATKLGGKGGTANQTNDAINWVAMAIYSRLAYSRLQASGTLLEEDDQAPEVVANILGLEIPLPDANGVFSEQDWSDNPAYLSRWTLNTKYGFNLDNNWFADADIINSADYCDHVLLDKSNSELLQLPQSEFGNAGVNYNFYRSTAMLSANYYDYQIGNPVENPFLQQNDIDYFPFEPRNPDDRDGTGFPSYPIDAIPPKYRRRYTANLLVSEEIKAIDFLFDILFPSANLFLGQQANGKLAIKVAKPSDFTFVKTANSIGSNEIEVLNIHPWRDKTTKILIGANLPNSEVRTISATRFIASAIPVTATGGIATNSATLSGGTAQFPPSATLTVQNNSDTKVITIDNYQIKYPGGGSLEAIAAAIAGQINAHEVLNKYTKAKWNKDATILITSRSGILTLDSNLGFIHNAKIDSPATAPALSAINGGTFEAGTYYVYYSFLTAAGETPVSPHTNITISDNQFIRVGAITKPAGVNEINYYCSIEAEGIRPHLAGSGDGAAFDITILPSIDARIEPNYNATAEEIHHIDAVFTDKANPQTSLLRSNMLKDSFKFPIGNRQPSTNQIEIKFRDASQDFRLSELRVNDKFHQDKVKKVNKKEINGAAIDSYHQARRLANQSLAQFRDGDLFQAFSSDGEALLLEEGDFIAVTDESGEFINEPMRVEDVEISDSGGYPKATITARKYRRYYFDDQVTEKLVPIPIIVNNPNNTENNKPLLYQAANATNTSVMVGVNNFTSNALYRKVEVADNLAFSNNLITVSQEASEFPGNQLPGTFRVTKAVSPNAETKHIRVSHSSNNVTFSPLSDTLSVTFADSGGGGGTGGGDDGPPACFFAGTKIFGKDEEFDIENVKIDNIVKTFDETGKIHYRKVTKVFEHTVYEHIELIFSDGVTIKTTREHPFWTEDKIFTGAGRLRKYEFVKVYGENKEWQTKQLISRIIKPGKIKVYNFEVDEFHAYFADGFAVHNSKEIELPPNQ